MYRLFLKHGQAQQYQENERNLNFVSMFKALRLLAKPHEWRYFPCLFIMFLAFSVIYNYKVPRALIWGQIEPRFIHIYFFSFLVVARTSQEIFDLCSKINQMNTIETKARPTTFNTLVATMVPLKYGDEMVIIQPLWWKKK